MVFENPFLLHWCKLDCYDAEEFLILLSPSPDFFLQCSSVPGIRYDIPLGFEVLFEYLFRCISVSWILMTLKNS